MIPSILVIIASLLIADASGGQKKSEGYGKQDVPKIDLAAGYKVDPDWPRKSAEVSWGAMPGVAVDEKNRIWTLNRGNMPVQVYATDGKFLFGWGQGQFKSAHGLRIDSKGNVWAGDTELHVVRQFTSQGKLLLTLGTPGKPGEDATHLNKPTDIAITPTGDVFVADGYGNNRVVHFNTQGQFVKSWGKLGVGAGQLDLPHAIALDSKGRIYVAERNNARIQVFDQNGQSLDQWRNLFVPWGIWITPDDTIYVCGSSPMRHADTEREMLGLPPKDQMVFKLDTTGRILELWSFPLGETGKEKPGDLNWLHGIAADAQGNLYLGDVHGNRAQKFVRLNAGR